MREDDAPEVVRILDNRAVTRYTLFPPVDEATVRMWIRDAGESEESRKYRWWAIEAAGFAGFCGVVLEPQYEAAEVWYMLDQPWWGQGAGTAAARLLIDKAFDEFNLHRVWAHVCPPNTASARILEKLGLRREGLISRNLKIHGEWVDSYLYAVLREEWPAGPARAGG